MSSLAQKLQMQFVVVAVTERLLIYIVNGNNYKIMMSLLSEVTQKISKYVNMEM